MDRAQDAAPHPAHLPLGTVVGPWRVVDWAGRGVYGAVYKAVRVEEEHALPVALKVALVPGDPRFAREAELLRGTSHPSIPRLIEAGDWQHPSGPLHPYLAMEWEVLAEDTPPEPQPGQTRPDAAGRCPHKRQVALNGGCWAPLKVEREECEAASGQMFKDRCYVPVIPHGRPPPFSPANTP